MGEGGGYATLSLLFLILRERLGDQIALALSLIEADTKMLFKLNPRILSIPMIVAALDSPCKANTKNAATVPIRRPSIELIIPFMVFVVLEETQLLKWGSKVS